MAALTLAQKIAVWAVPVLLAITVHEVAHGYVARMRGDRTAEAAGRLTLNPLRHVDPIGTILVPAVMLMFSNFLFGWARPVPVNARNLHNPRRDMALVAAAGPGVNLLMALVWALLVRVVLTVDLIPVWVAEPVAYMGIAGIFINVILMVLNLLPIPPLDGGRVAVGVLPLALAGPLAKLERWGLVIVVLLLVSGGLGYLLGPVVWPIMQLLAAFAGISPETFNAALAQIT